MIPQKPLGPKEGRLPPGLLSPTYSERRRKTGRVSKYLLVIGISAIIFVYVFGSSLGLYQEDGTERSINSSDGLGSHVISPGYAKFLRNTVMRGSNIPVEDSQKPLEPVKINKNNPATIPKESSQVDPVAQDSVKTESSRPSSSVDTPKGSAKEADSGPTWWKERPAFEKALQHVLSILPDELHMRELIRPIESGGKERMREIGLRTRDYRQYFEAWESLHVDKTGKEEAFVRDDIIQYLRASRGLAKTSVHWADSAREFEDDAKSEKLAQTIRSYESFRLFIAKFANILYPWTSPYFADHMTMHAHIKNGGRGIVLTAGDDQAPFLLTTIYSFRRLGCELPIEVMYLGESDLGEDYRAELESLPGVTTRDMAQMVNDEGWRLAGWAAKPFAILLSSFREVIFIDADSLFFKNPGTLFEDKGYRKTGALFFHDRRIMPESKKRWLQQVIPRPTPKIVKQSRWWTGESGHMQESGVIVVDKWRHFLSLLLVCRLNGSDRDTRDGRQGVYEMMYGDKETFWIGFLLAGDEGFTFHRGDAGIMGVPKGPEEQEQTGDNDASDKDVGDAVETATRLPIPVNHTICAPQLLHLDNDGKPLWFNGWLLHNKFADRSSRQFAEFKSYLIEPREVRDPGAWQLTTDNICCLTSDADKKFDFDEAERETIDMIVRRAKAINEENP